ncbi:MAG: nitroreductase family deazaflavin-dependent oxidoreductase [Acidimicrobiales bacterium]|jgi:deazaflavin-dependent oxidoreductase (nitroreductase family)
MAETNDFNTQIIKEFRDNAGRVGGPFEGAPMLLLTTKGAKTGTSRVNPMMYLAEDGRRYVFASKAGAPTNPDWYHNLLAHPEVSIEVGSDVIEVVAVPLTGSERDRVYAEQASRYPGFAEYQEKTDRVIPVVALDPR